MFTQSRLCRDFAFGSTDGDESWLLPVNSIAGVMITLKAKAVSANPIDNPLSLAAHLLSIQVRHRGSQIVAISGPDLLRLTAAMGLYNAQLLAPGVGAAADRAINLWLPFGRRFLSPTEAYPQTSKGESELYISYDAVTTLYNTLLLTVTPIELIDATPSRFLRYTTATVTPTATGDYDIDLPRMAPLAGLGVYMTSTFPTVATPTLSSIKVLLNNLDQGYTDLDPVTARDIQHMGMPRSLASAQIFARENVGGAYVQNAITGSTVTGDDAERDFVYLDYDPQQDGSHLLAAPSSLECKIRATFSAVSPIRLIPVELFSPSLLPGGKRPK